MGGNVICAGGGEGARFERSSTGTGRPFMLQPKKRVRKRERTERMEIGKERGKRRRPGSRRRSTSPDDPRRLPWRSRSLELPSSEIMEWKRDDDVGRLLRTTASGGRRGSGRGRLHGQRFPCTTVLSAEGERTWSGNFHHNGRTAFQVRRCTGHEGVMVERRCNLPNNTD